MVQKLYYVEYQLGVAVCAVKRNWPLVMSSNAISNSEIELHRGDIVYGGATVLSLFSILGAIS